MTVWEVEYTDQFETWWTTLTQEEQAAIEAAVAALQRDGPALGRPLVDTIKGSRHRNMKELRPPRGNIRFLFAFDPRRTAILLLGGDKTNQWEAWYQRSTSLADQLYDDYLRELRQEGELR
jgi:hypothetical protein